MENNMNAYSNHTTPADNRDVYWNQLGHVVSMATKEDQITRMIFSMFWVANALLLVALFATGKMPIRKVGAIISAMGVIISLVWFFIQWRSIGWLEYYERIIQRLEKRLSIPPGIALSSHLNTRTLKVTVGRCIPSVRLLMIVSACVLALLWTLSLLWFA